MPDFLLEIGTEEIPARMMDSAWQDLSKRIVELLLRASLFDLEKTLAEIAPNSTGLGFQVCATPRRLTFVVPGVAGTQADITEQLTGPATKVAYKDGQPTPAAHAFAKKAGVDVSQLQTVTTPKGEYLTASVTNQGKPASQVLAELLPKEIAAIYWPKNMYWRAGKPERFVRPVRWIVAMLDGEIIPMEFAGIKAGNQSRGHRILGPAQVPIALPSQYVATMQGAHVTALSADREYKIRKALDAVTRTVPGARWREDAELLKTVVNLTECPSAILGSFDKEYLSLPEEVLVTVMRDHQKYFAVEDAAGKLAPHFLTVLNTDGDPDGLICHGNERVLRARFNDAQFFWDTDQKTPLVNRVEMLKVVTFQKDLGSYAAKADRMVSLGDRLCRAVDSVGLKVDPNAIEQAARYAKTDLTTELVKEFTELQGVIGGLYAKVQGLRPSIADAIYDQYKPGSTEDSAPRTLEGAVISIADKADSIAGMFALGLVPSGSKDPFALRRQANGIVKTIVEHKLPLSLSRLMAVAREQYAGSEAEKKFTLKDEAYAEAVRGFFRERLEFYLRDVLGLTYDVVNATLAAGADDVVDAVARAEAIKEVRSSADFSPLFVAFKRIKNIIKQAEEKKFVIRETDVRFEPTAVESGIWQEMQGIGQSFLHRFGQKDYAGALKELAGLRAPVDSYFEKVMVMDEDPEIRASRLGVVNYLLVTFNKIADLSELVVESK
jgi:glycyl-tRNA synthetase beta chain